MPAPHDHNRSAWNKLANKRQRLTRPAAKSDFKDPLKTLDPLGWLGDDIAGQNLLCLAAGGGKDSVLFAAAGANVTVVDISPAMLEQDRQVANERGLDIRIIEASMDNLSMLADAQFDVVVQPVSTCYVPDISPIYKEMARVTRPGGLYISQHKQPASLQASHAISPNGYVIHEPYYREGPLPLAPADSRLRESGTQEYLHGWEQLVGELCRTGFVIEDLVEPNHADQTEAPGQYGHRCQYLAPYVCLKARRLNDTVSTGNPDIWTG